MEEEIRKRIENGTFTDDDIVSLMCWQLSLPGEEMDCVLIDECDRYLSRDAAGLSDADRDRMWRQMLARIGGAETHRRAVKPARPRRISRRRATVLLLLALLALDLLAVVGMRTSGRNTIRAGSPFGRLPALLVPAVLAVLAVAACALLLAARGELIPIFQAVGSLLEGALIAVFRFLTSLFQGRSAGSAGMSSAAGGGSEAALPVESASGPAIAPQLVTALLLLSLAALVLAGVAALVRWLWRSRSRIRLPEEDDDDGLVRQRLGRRGLLSRLGQRLRVRAFLLRYAGTPRAALLELERWGARRRCRRQSQETPREYLERLAGGPLRDALDAPMQARYSILVDDVERSLYSTLPPRLSREQVRELLSTVHRSARTPPARAK